MVPSRMIDMHTHPVFELADVDGILRFMDKYGVETVVALGSPSRDDMNDRILKLRRLAPERIIGGPFVDPRDPGALEEIKRCHDGGCRILKLFPNLGYYADDPQLLPFFEQVTGMGWGILSHCGWLGSKSISSTKYARPGRFEELFRRFPETLFIMAHMGGMDGFLEGIMYTTRTPNVYLDTTPGQSYWVFEHAPAVVRGMRRERLLMGTDGIAPPYEDGTDCGEHYGKLAEAIEKLGWGEHVEDIFYNHAAGVIEKYHLLP